MEGSARPPWRCKMGLSEHGGCTCLHSVFWKPSDVPWEVMLPSHPGMDFTLFSSLCDSVCREQLELLSEKKAMLGFP